MRQGQAAKPSLSASAADHGVIVTPRAPGFSILGSGASPVTEEFDGRFLPPMLGTADGPGFEPHCVKYLTPP
jgi:hypothetical protein